MPAKSDDKAAVFARLVQDLHTKESLKAKLKEALGRLSFYELVKPQEPYQIPAYKLTAGDAIAVALLSDLHLEERVDPADVPGTYNIYNPTIARKRMEQFAQRVVALIMACRNFSNIKDLVLALLGDCITGFLHDDNRESNWMAPPDALLFAREVLNMVIRHLLDYGGFDRIIIPCCFGNHGRMTPKPRAKTAAQTNLEYLLYNILASDWKDEPRVIFHVAKGNMLYLDLLGFTCRFTHGDDVDYQGGTGGIGVPLLRAVKDWNGTKDADYTFLGHHHQGRDFEVAVVNGSLIGYNAYASRKHLPFELPRQKLVLLNAKRGKSFVADVWTDYTPGAGEADAKYCS